jgi:hypothetical protein
MASRSRRHRHTTEPDLALQTQYLASVLNNPNETESTLASWSSFLGLGGDAPSAEEPPPIAPGILPEVLPADFEAGPYPRTTLPP